MSSAFPRSSSKDGTRDVGDRLQGEPRLAAQVYWAAFTLFASASGPYAMRRELIGALGAVGAP
jgi:hypothetical protein